MAAAAALDRSQAVEELAKLRVEAGQLSQEVEDHRLIMTAKSDSGKKQEYCNEFIRPRSAVRGSKLNPAYQNPDRRGRARDTRGYTDRSRWRKVPSLRFATFLL